MTRDDSQMRCCGLLACTSLPGWWWLNTIRSSDSSERKKIEGKDLERIILKLFVKGRVNFWRNWKLIDERQSKERKKIKIKLVIERTSKIRVFFSEETWVMKHIFLQVNLKYGGQYFDSETRSENCLMDLYIFYITGTPTTPKFSSLASFRSDPEYE